MSEGETLAMALETARPFLDASSDNDEATVIQEMNEALDAALRQDNSAAVRSHGRS
jgi:hypothetical protein